MQPIRSQLVGAWFVFFLSAASAAAMDRWLALAKFESNNNDLAVGRAGEVSRFQITPALWKANAAAGSSPRDARTAGRVARSIMDERCVAFERHRHRRPSDFEFYVLWNAPAYLLQGKPVSHTVAGRARRFCRLVATRTPAKQVSSSEP